MIKLDSVSEQTEKGLKPCPFCGGEAFTKAEIVHIVKTEMYFSVECKKCGICKGVYAKQNCSFDDIISAINLAVESWNRRADNG